MFTASEIKNLTLELDNNGQSLPTQQFINLSVASRFSTLNFQRPIGVTISVTVGAMVYVMTIGGVQTTLSAGELIEITGAQYLTFAYAPAMNGSFQVLYEADVPFIDLGNVPPPLPLPIPPYSVVQTSLLSGKAPYAYVDEKVALLSLQIAAAQDRIFTHNQVNPSTVWTINHNLGKLPAVTVIDSAGTRVFGSEEHPTPNRTILRFTAGFSGSAHFN